MRLFSMDHVPALAKAIRRLPDAEARAHAQRLELRLTAFLASPTPTSSAARHDWQGTRAFLQAHQHHPALADQLPTVLHVAHLIDQRLASD